MKLRFSTSLGWKGRVIYDGDEIDTDEWGMSDKDAEAYIRTRQAERIDAPVETAALRTQPAKGRDDARSATTNRLRPQR